MLSFSQNEILNYFKDAVLKGTLHSSYIIYGPKGCGKSHLSTFIQMVFACEKSNACAVCDGCKRAINKSDLDILYLEPNEKGDFEVKSVREIIKKVNESTFLSKYKLVIIDDSQNLDKVCQNALLKIIETPSENTVFVFLTNSLGSLLPTIKSRCINLKLEAFKVDELKKIVELDEKDEYLYTYSQGDLKKLKLLSKDASFKDIREKTIELFINLFNSPESFYEAVRFFADDKETRNEKINILSLVIRDVLMYKKGLDEMILNEDKKDQIKKLDEILTQTKCFEILDLTLSLEGKFNHNENPTMQFYLYFNMLRGIFHK